MAQNMPHSIFCRGSGEFPNWNIALCNGDKLQIVWKFKLEGNTFPLLKIFALKLGEANCIVMLNELELPRLNSRCYLKAKLKTNHENAKGFNKVTLDFFVENLSL